MLGGCASHKKNFFSKTYHNTTARYNAYFLAKERIREVEEAVASCARIDDVEEALRQGCRDNALQLALRSLRPGCLFNIVGFGSRHESLFAKSRPYDDASLAEASAQIEAGEICPMVVLADERMAAIGLTVSNLSHMGADFGNTSIYVGGDKKAYDSVKEVLNTISKISFHVAKIGEAQTVKLITNLLFYSQTVICGECLAIAREAGIPPYEPRGCQRGISCSWYLYSPLRVKYPYIRGALLDLWRQAKAAHEDPVDAWKWLMSDPDKRARYQRARGKGGFRRVKLSEAIESLRSSGLSCRGRQC